MAKTILLGAHTSIAGGVHNALLEGQKIGASTIQMFTANQRRWIGKPISDDEIKLWKKTLEETGLQQIMSHNSYLTNLGAPDPENLEKSQEAFKDEIRRCIQLDITYLNFHPGSALSDTRENCLNRISESVLTMVPLLQNSSLRLLLEITAGQGSCVGCRFEEIAYLIQKLEKHVRIGVCFDTCHAFAAGYDLRTKEACDATFREFDRIIGLKHLYTFHLNDSLKGLGSRVDRHQPLGKGQIGEECFRFLMTDPRTRDLPKYLETPDGPPLWEKEIIMLKSFIRN